MRSPCCRPPAGDAHARPFLDPTPLAALFPDVYCRGYLAAEDKLKAAGVEEVLVYCVNDGAVMDGWAKDQGVAGSIVTFLADTRAELTKALGMEMTHPGPMSDLGNLRCKRHAALVVDGVITAFNVSEAEGDPGEWQQQHTHTHR